MKLIQIIAFILFVTGAFAQSTIRKTDTFRKVVIKVPVDATLIRSDSSYVKFSSDNASIQNIKTTVEDSVLYIEMPKGTEGLDEVSMNIYYTSLEGVNISGTADLKSEGTINAEKFKIGLSGAGDLNLDLKATDVTLEISGAGDVKLSGEAKSMRSRISGAGDLSAADFKTESQDIKVSGAGDAVINVSKSLIAEVSGAGSVSYKGDPSDKTVEVSGAGSVTDINGDIHIGISGNGDSKSSGDSTVYTGKEDTTRLKFGDIRIHIMEKEKIKAEKKDGEKKKDEDSKREKKGKPKSIYAGLEFGINGFTTPGNSFKLPANQQFLELDYSKSWVMKLNFWEQNFKIYKNYISLLTGMGVEFNRYALANKVTLLPAGTTLSYVPTLGRFKKNHLNTTFLTVPFMLELNSSRKHKRSFHLAAGGEFGYIIGSRTVQEFVSLGGTKTKNKVEDSYQLNAFRYGPSIRVGYGKLNLFANYSLAPLFKSGKGPELYPFSAGITLIGF